MFIKIALKWELLVDEAFHPFLVFEFVKMLSIGGEPLNCSFEAF